jgi:hypothetical protein
MYQDCLNTYILDIKCKFARLAATSSDSLALLSKKADCQLFKAKIIDLYLHELQCYKAFRSQVFGAWSIDIVPSTIEDYNITLTLNTGTYLVSGTMSSEQLIIELYNLLKIDTNLDVNYTDNTLYIISYVNTLTYNDTITLTDSVLIDFNSINNGMQLLFRFDNDFGLSVVCHSFSYGNEKATFEVAVIKFSSNGRYNLTYDTHITDDVLGYQSKEDVISLIEKVILLQEEMYMYLLVIFYTNKQQVLVILILIFHLHIQYIQQLLITQIIYS